MGASRDGARASFGAGADSMGWDWTSPEDILLFLGLMIALIFFRAWNTNRKMRRLRGLFDGGGYERKGTGIIATRYIGRFRGRRAVLSFDPRGWGRPGNFDIEVACRAPWGFYARTLLERLARLAERAEGVG